MTTTDLYKFGASLVAWAVACALMGAPQGVPFAGGLAIGLWFCGPWRQK